MGLQIVFCVEAKKSSKTDYIYIKATVESFYSFDRANTRLSPIYLNGKGNYTSKKVCREITKYTNQYRVAAKGNETIVVFCFDCDEYDRRPEDLKFLQDAEEYCKKHGYKFVWFCKDVESVYIGKTVPDNQKVKIASDFKKKQLIKQVDLRNLRADQYLNQKSNICNVLDEVFNE